MPITKYFFTACTTILLLSNLYGQVHTQSDKIKALNNYVNFSNESSHGLLIIHRLLENFNKNINKYVDLPDQQINFYSNNDLPKDIFEDPEKWFYDISPNAWYDKMSSIKGVLPVATEAKLNAEAAAMKNVIFEVNKIRFDLEDQIKKLDLTKRENLSLVYDKLEEGVKLYKNYYTHQLAMEAEIKAYYQSMKVTEADRQFPLVMNALDKIYKTTRSVLTALYNKDDDNMGDLIKAQRQAYDNFLNIRLEDYNSTRLINTRVQLYWSNIKRQTGESIKAAQAFAEAENVPEEYKLYDKYYYYYNISVINKFNRYGNGIVFEINRILDYLAVPEVRYFEVPHYFKVIYPKLLDKTKFLAASDPVIKSLPTIVKGRNVVTATRTIKVDSFKVEFKMYDHKIIDKDIVSLSFNGDWIVEKFEITDKPYEFTLKLNKEGKNFILLHADDMGRQPPATIALSYRYKGKKELIILNSDTVKSEIIEIVVQK